MATARRLLGSLVMQLGIGVCTGVVCGSVCAAFALALAAVTGWRCLHPSVVYGLFAIGLAMGACLSRWGQSIEGGTKRVFSARDGHGASLSWQMVPVTFVCTLATHLGGGSAGREGAAVQIGASLADSMATLVRPSQPVRRCWIVAGMAAGFGSVFGTPVAATLFAFECGRNKPPRADAWLAAAVAAWTGHCSAEWWGVMHGGFARVAPLSLSLVLASKWLVFAACVAVVAEVFVRVTEAITQGTAWLWPARAWRQAFGGACVTLAFCWLGHDTYLGLGDDFIRAAFVVPDVPKSAVALKLLLTSVTVGTGFVGGEVTPLFFTGAALGNVLAASLQLPLASAAGCGLAGVFAAAAKAPVTMAAMAAELLGIAILPHALIVTVAACALRRGSPGLYGPQPSLPRTF